jgi:hypothetical protein
VPRSDRLRRLEKALKAAKFFEPLPGQAMVVIENRAQVELVRTLPEKLSLPEDYDPRHWPMFEFHEFAELMLEQRVISTADWPAWTEQVELSRRQARDDSL